MESRNLEIIILSPDELETCILPKEAEGRFWLYSRFQQKRKKLVEVWGKDGTWYLLKNKMYKFPSSMGQQIPLHAPMTFCIKDEIQSLYVLCHQTLSQSYDHYALEDHEEYTIGRNPQASLVINNPMISTLHATIRNIEDTWMIVDEDSTNGVYVNCKRIYQSSLQPGDCIQIMQYFMVMGKDTLLIQTQDDVEIHMEQTKPTLDQVTPVKYRKVMPAMRETKQLPTLCLEVEMPQVIQTENKVPFLISSGPSLTMGLSSLGMAAMSVLQANLQKQPFISVLPTLMMSISMAISMMVWPLFIRKYEDKQKRKAKEEQTQCYLAYLQQMDDQIQQHIRLESSMRNTLYEDQQDILHMLKEAPWLLHIRTPQDASFLQVSMGLKDIIASIQLVYAKEPMMHPQDPCWQAYESFKQKDLCIPQQKVCINATVESNIGIYGFDSQCVAFLMDKLFQLFFLHDQRYLQFCILADQALIQAYQLQFIPSIYTKECRFLVSDKENAKQIDYQLRQWWQQKQEETYLVFFSFDRQLEEAMPFLSSLLQEKQVMYFQCASQKQYIRPECHVVYDLNDASYQPSLLTEKQMRTALSYYHTLVFETKEEKQFPSSFTFMDLYQCGNVEQLQILKRWEHTSASFEALIGIDEYQKPIALDLHEHFHGPHGLIAGMTGSGKSEWIITLLLSLATSYSPKDISFVLIDYKGGGMAQVFKDLPHIAGIMTNLDEDQIQRSMQGIQSEMKRRQIIFKETQQRLHKNVMHIDQYRKLYTEGQVEEPMSHIFIVADEFAELKQQQTAFMEDLKQVARIGRSLGIHLLLATQKPSGIVDDQIWSNARFHVCLKVQDKMDSVEMLKKEDAAYLKEAGMFYLQVGYDEWYIKGLGAWSNAPYLPRDYYEPQKNQMLSILSTSGQSIYEKELKIQQMSNQTQLEAVIAYIQHCAKQIKVSAKPLWLKNLEMESYETLVDMYQDERVFAQLDLPHEQRYAPFLLSLEQLMNMAIFISRKEDEYLLLQAFIRAVSSDTIIYVFSQQEEPSFASYVNDVIVYQDIEKVESYFYQMNQRIQQHQKGRVVTIFKDYASFVSKYASLLDSLYEMMQQGKQQCYFYFMMNHSMQLNYQLKSLITTTLCFYLKEEDDYQVIFHDVTSTSALKTIGRGLVEKDQAVLQFQLAHVQTLLKRSDHSIPVLAKTIKKKWDVDRYYLGVDCESKQDVWISKEQSVLFVCAIQFYEPWIQLAQDNEHWHFITMKELQQQMYEEQIQQLMHQSKLIWIGTGLSEACYQLKLPYIQEESLKESVGVLWENEQYRFIKLMEE